MNSPRACAWSSRDHLPCKPGRLLMVLALFAATHAGAHGPFDHSSRLIVSETQLELVVTMGADATRDFLTSAGLAPGETMQILSLTSGQSARALPVEVGAKLFEVSAGGKPVAAVKVSVITDGLETLFTLVFPRPDHGALDLRAIYFNGIEPMKRGAFVAYDENMRQLGEAFLSRANDSIQISLPAKTSVEADWEPAAAAEPAPTDPVGASQPSYPTPGTARPSSSVEFQKSNAGTGQIAVVAVVVAVVVPLLFALALRFRRS